MNANAPLRLTRWMLESQQPKSYSLGLDHPAQEDIAWAADRITKLKAENVLLNKHLHRAQSAESDVARCVLRAETAEAKVTHYETLKQVVRWILRPDDRGPVFDNLGEGTIDGGDIQDLYEKLGILIPITVTEPCCENCQCASWDDFPQTCYRLAGWMK